MSEEEEDDEHGKFVALDVGRAHMTGMLCRLKDWSVCERDTHVTLCKIMNTYKGR